MHPRQFSPFARHPSIQHLDEPLASPSIFQNTFQCVIPYLLFKKWFLVVTTLIHRPISPSYPSISPANPLSPINSLNSLTSMPLHGSQSLLTLYIPSDSRQLNSSRVQFCRSSHCSWAQQWSMWSQKVRSSGEERPKRSGGGLPVVERESVSFLCSRQSLMAITKQGRFGQEGCSWRARVRKRMLKMSWRQGYVSPNEVKD
ncbi:hypothetical protein FGO68_gene324 [Halteria grandinella]|uniref:Uncharacterized protein n=1 Tax=Halteria grandinella TaxID=5974 RepID=A0A8J8T331_HALGN|nr:hypothetical protein FGO68_gene324 [Halteria grandinella]